ncbi:hydroxypyruvate isomerase family protein [Mesorhizobium sp. M1A.F.Ca.IN.022.07.1.1]|uniref:2-oxo-tetronate isomerase n=2 Tax=Mesorhizobium TaxID=68287 RepID=UPI000F75FF4E|nr:MULTISPECIES: 2-oxo-tetronate isomerase [unclassified Mesorhizobium]TGV92990.1 hydroxypyruvate isomerase family protein [Mesorhizobium sp. M00.F.Ca.ET.158.01.1.1]AZO62038.1 hydroxypyruvate isomerase family protein [Mesorhizobium sp. M1A.F.Ca.IN.022.06.1.1]MCT2579705.1 hydroxypyruvate isomerase family protein [Mesorhizobium sp. P13.3]MDF3168938.1 hydroxypyruvate isomerase family protein [Mesorhizobium sp. P16.1]MDF3178514.1 hydroxypyruvate isomerase family protein [Mesorhizobium sp. P17.1]
MPRFAANLTMMFSEWPFLDRFQAAADAGFRAVEFLFPYEHTPEAIGERLRRYGLTQALFNLPPGDWAAGERGLAALPDRFAELQAAVAFALPYAEATGVKRLHLMSGLAAREDRAAVDTYRKAIIWTAGKLADRGIDLVIEPINGRDMPGYFLNDFDFAEQLIGELALPNLKLQFDVYHRQILHGDVVMALRRLLPIIGHVQIASVPSRHEPTSEELNDRFIFAELDGLGYDGFVGCEYRPGGKTLEGLGWFAPFASGPLPQAGIGVSL